LAADGVIRVSDWLELGALAAAFFTCGVLLLLTVQVAALK
jgi:hypothetical protein